MKANDKKASPKLNKRDPKTVQIVAPEGGDDDALMAKTYLQPEVLAACALKTQHANQDTLTVNALIDELKTQVSLVQAGDMGRAEAMLISQAHTLDALFVDMLDRARTNMGRYPDAVHRYMTMAFKAQAQCRATIEGLAEIKNPRPFIQNNRADYQQVNNGTNTGAPARAGKYSKNANGLLEDKSHEQDWLDSGTAQTAGGNNQAMETVGAIDRTQD